MISILVTAVIVVLFFMLTLKALSEFGMNGAITSRFNTLELGVESNISEGETIRKIFFMSLFSRIMILIIGMIIVKTFNEGDKNIMDCLAEIQKWDTRHYINLVEKGYSGYVEDGKHLFLVFFPAYVWIVRLVRVVIPNTMLAGILVSIICYALGCSYTYKIARHYYNEKVAKQSVVYLSLFPFSFFSGLVMTEGLFLLATAGACYYAIKRKWVLFGLFGILASTTRMVGVLVIIFAGIEIVKEYKPLEKPVIESMKKNMVKLIRYVPILITPLIGTLIYWGLNYYVDGDMFAYITHQEHWSQGFMWFPKVIEYLSNYFIGRINEAVTWQIQFPALALLFIFVIIMFMGIKNKVTPASLLIYTFCYVVINYCLSWLLSAGRYLSCCFAIFIILAKITEEKESSKAMIIGLEAIFLGIYFVSYLTGGMIM